MEMLRALESVRTPFLNMLITWITRLGEEMIIIGVFCLIFGVFGPWIIHFLFGFNLQISIGGYIEKAIIFAISLGIGLIVTRYASSANILLEKLGMRMNFGFRGICASIGVFFGVILVVAWFMQ